ncbi:NAD(P)H-binding protein [Zunongwangia pacifica]|uniref:NAD(P)H-binding protein n=1 Tax=Zunongwangia pacifica TaxID=2911062 RepID=A0A9X1ZWC3_9FLAO|nr:NAD(P)H-binding protein [Zunongwangia pacifica]MCL6217541.1 NAD(P)H-binding protein [Zunongwangia pacifica]
MGVATVVESLENTPEAIGYVIKNYEAVVFSAGSGGKTGHDKTMEIDLDGAIKAINQAEKQGIKRFVMVSASHSDDRSYWGKVDGMKPYYIAKHYADLELKRSALDYTILRPVTLTDDDEAGKVLMTDNPDEVNSKIPRQAVAETVLEVLKNPKTYGKVIEMSKGEHEIPEALAKVCS